MELFIVIALLVAAFFYFRRPVTSDSKFSQAGVSVDYAQASINIQGIRYPTSKVRGIRWETEYNNSGVAQSYVFIQVEDMKRPVHKIRFLTAGSAETFCMRLQLALEQAASASLSR